MADKNPIWKFFISVKLTVVLLLTLAATSIIGTLIPQNANPEGYFQKFGPFLYRLFDLLDIFDMYHSWWFQLLLLLLTCNIIACSVERLSSTWKLIFPKKISFKRSTFEKIKQNEQFTDPRTPDELAPAFTAAVQKAFGAPRVEKTDNGLTIFAEKWRWTRLGVYIVHISILFMIVGAMIGSLFGYSGHVNIPEGERADHVLLRNSNRIERFGFEIQNNDFNISFYPNGTPKEFRSKLTIRENNQDVLSKDIIVNDPLRYKGISIFMSHYGEIAPERPPEPAFSQDDIQLSFMVNSSGMIYKRKAEIGKPLDIPEGMGKFVLMEFRESAAFMGQNIGQALVGILTPPGGQPLEVTLPIHFPKFDKMRRGNVVISVVHQHKHEHAKQNPEDIRYYSGLQIVKDPGVWVVYTGFIIMIAGILITFFMSHQQICIDISKKGKKSQIKVAGKANKNQLGMERTITNLARSLAETKEID
jgi:cytochrome c biogenesis protein